MTRCWCEWLVDREAKVAEVRNARAEAQALVGEGYSARVLEPSSPAVDEEPYVADDPVDPSEAGGTVVSPLAGAPRTWSDWVADHPDRGDWVAERWLGAYRSLPDLPDGYASSRDALQSVLTHVMTPARFRANGKIAVRWTKGGFGTPFFRGTSGDDEQVRVEGGELVVQRGESVEACRLTTLADAADLALGGDPDLSWTECLDLHDPPEAADPGGHLVIDPAAAVFLGEWFGFAWSVLEQLRADDASIDPSRPQLWPEHFDPAIEVGSDAGKRRASYGFSPGDGSIPEPYVYVSIWYPDQAPDSELWNAESYKGAELRLSDFAGEDDQRDFVLAWLRDRRDRLAE